MKRESTHFERDYDGSVRRVTRSGDMKRSSTPVSDALLRQSSEKKGRVSKMFGDYSKRRSREREIYRQEYSRAREGALKSRARSAGRSSAQPYRIDGNFNPFGSMFDSGMDYSRPSKKKTVSKTKYTVVGGKAYPVVGSGKKKSSKRKKTSGRSSGGFDMMDNWGFF